MRHEQNTDGMRELWQEVLRQAIDDALMDVPEPSLCDTYHKFKRAQEMRRDRDDARAWFRNNDDFRVVCTFAGMDPEAVLDRYNSGLVRRVDIVQGRTGTVASRGAEHRRLVELRREAVARMTAEGKTMLEIQRALAIGRGTLRNDRRALGYEGRTAA